MESELVQRGGPGLRRFDSAEYGLLKQTGFDPEDLSNTRVAAGMLRMDVATLHSLCRNYGVPRFNVNGRVRFHVALVKIWLLYHPTLWTASRLANTPDISGR